MKRYEYKVLTTDAKGLWGGKVDAGAYERELNKLGAEGWELVETIASNETYGSTRYVISTFKREI